MTPLDLSDKYVRRMADRNHQPAEVWALDGSLIRVSCEACGHEWPCGTRRALDSLEAAGR